MDRTMSKSSPTDPLARLQPDADLDLLPPRSLAPAAERAESLEHILERIVVERTRPEAARQRDSAARASRRDLVRRVSVADRTRDRTVRIRRDCLRLRSERRAYREQNCDARQRAYRASQQPKHERERRDSSEHHSSAANPVEPEQRTQHLPPHRQLYAWVVVSERKRCDDDALDLWRLPDAPLQPAADAKRARPVPLAHRARSLVQPRRREVEICERVRRRLRKRLLPRKEQIV